MEKDWYETLESYFPSHELKSPEQMEDLFERNVAYHREQTDEYLIIYAEFAEFIFIDYLLVNPKERGAGTGSRLLNRFKERGKTLLAEVEPAKAANPDSQKRIHFYEKNGFQRAQNIAYVRETADGHPFPMNIYYWSATEESERHVLEEMEIVCEQIHNFHSKRHYGRIPADPDTVLRWKDGQEN